MPPSSDLVMRCIAPMVLVLLVTGCVEARPESDRRVDTPVERPEVPVVVAPAPVVEVPVVPAAEPVKTAEAVADTPELEVIARLVEPQSAPHCGTFQFVVVMRYEVIEVLAGSLAAKELFVAHSCPELVAKACKGVAGERVRGFKKDAVHHMRLDSRRGSGALIDKFADKSAQRYRASCVTVVTAPAR